MKKLLIVAASCMALQFPTVVLAEEVGNNSASVAVCGVNTDEAVFEDIQGDVISLEIEEKYREIVTEFYEKGINLDISLEEYADLINQGKKINYNKYTSKNKNSSDAEISLYSSGSDKYYYDTGTSCPAQVDYTGTRLLAMVSAGDIVYEDNGGLGITGHIAIVEGKFYSATQKKYYIRLVEAVSSGVCRGVLDATRCEEKRVSILKFKYGTPVSSDMKKKAINFAISQIGKPYDIDIRRKGYSSTQSGWYCSELVWAAYYNQGINIEKNNKGEPGITPHDILNSESLATSYYYK